jgi:regulator of RNase E activity RraB
VSGWTRVELVSDPEAQEAIDASQCSIVGNLTIQAEIVAQLRGLIPNDHRLGGRYDGLAAYHERENGCTEVGSPATNERDAQVLSIGIRKFRRPPDEWQ